MSFKSKCLDKWWLSIVPFCITVAVMICLYKMYGYAPFGDNSLATMDASIQYLDFFSYLKDVLLGKNSITYTFSKTLGGANIAVFAYYLSSPFNLLALFFEKSNLTLFFNCLVVLKMATASATMAYFLRVRFQEKLNGYILVSLALSYAFMQYDIAQASNIMWLDGVYMLPLMLLGVYRLVNYGRSYLLIFATALSILFNWYSAGINCLYSAVWFILESLLLKSEDDFVCFFSKNRLKVACSYVVHMLLGLALSACLFLPTALSLSGGDRGKLDWWLFKSEFFGNIFTVIQNFTMGAKSAKGSVSLYCGSLVLLGVLGFFLSKKNKTSLKIRVGSVLAFSLFLYYWQPLDALFSLMKAVYSYWYRYSYVSIFLLVFIAGYYFLEVFTKRERTIEFVKTAFFFSACILLLSYAKPVSNLSSIYHECLAMFFIAGLLGLSVNLPQNRRLCRVFAGVMICLILIAELSVSTKLLMRSYHRKNVAAHANYSTNQQRQIDELKKYDSDFYRISQVATYNVDNNINYTAREKYLTANYNEALAYNYRSISGYTSDPDSLQLPFLDRAGYRRNNANFGIVNTSILATDSLLGVKYVLSPRDINGLERIDELKEYNGKKVYLNPYALPMAFVYPYGFATDESVQIKHNPFECLNSIYSELSGEKVILYKPLQFRVASNKRESVQYVLEIPNGNFALYGKLGWKSYIDNAMLNVNNAYKTRYAQWTAPSVFYIPAAKDDASATVTLTHKNDRKIVEEQFYWLDLDVLGEVTEKLSRHAPAEMVIENGYARFVVPAKDGESLFTSIPYNKGWAVTLNGRKVVPNRFADCLITVPLQNGDNVIEMSYHVPGLRAGVVISLLALAIVVLSTIFRKGKTCCSQ